MCKVAHITVYQYGIKNVFQANIEILKTHQLGKYLDRKNYCKLQGPNL